MKKIAANFFISMAMSKRILSIDIVRGIVMIIMALDHVRDLMHSQSLVASATNLATTSAPLFFSRWITYLCAPTFVFLSGVSVYLQLKRKDLNEIKSFLIKRGIWLIVLEFTIINFCLWFDIQFRILIMQVIAAIGAGFILISFLLRVSPKIISAIALIIIFGHNLLQFVPVSENPILRNIFFTPGAKVFSPHFMIFFAYPLIPWIGILLLGFAFGKIFEEGQPARNNSILLWGCVLLGLFIILRFINSYDDPAPWSTQKNGLFTFLSFINVSKYPPSLMFTLLFIGIALLMLRFSEDLPKPIQKVFSVYGSVPMFYYLLHLIFIRAAVFIMDFSQGFSYNDLHFGPFEFGRPAKEIPSGLPLAGVLAVWLLIVALLYPLCKWYGHYRRAHPEKTWLRYI